MRGRRSQGILVSFFFGVASDIGPTYPLSLADLLGLPSLGGVGGCDFCVCGGAAPANGFAPAAVAAVAGVAICVGSGACEIAATVGAAVLVGAAVGYGVAKAQDYFARAEQRVLDHIARKYCVDRNELGREVEEVKRMRGMPRNAKLSREEIEQIAQYLPKKPGCSPQ